MLKVKKTPQKLQKHKETNTSQNQKKYGTSKKHSPSKKLKHQRIPLWRVEQLAHLGMEWQTIIATIDLRRKITDFEVKLIQQRIAKAHARTYLKMLKIRLQQASKGRLSPLNELIKQLSKSSPANGGIALKVIRNIIQNPQPPQLHPPQIHPSTSAPAPAPAPAPPTPSPAPAPAPPTPSPAPAPAPAPPTPSPAPASPSTPSPAPAAPSPAPPTPSPAPATPDATNISSNQQLVPLAERHFFKHLPPQEAYQIWLASHNASKQIIKINPLAEPPSRVISTYSIMAKAPIF